MTDLVLHRESRAITLPAPRHGAISIRAATPEDIPFIDGLQKQHNKMVGFFPRAWFEHNIKTGHVLVAEEALGSCHSCGSRNPEESEGGHDSGLDSRLRGNDGSGSAHRTQPTARSAAKPLGYCVYKDKYLKREELGIVYQLNVAPGKWRGLIGASLVKAAFERCPYGVKLFCCWCAQDIEANHFWESIGFVPIAFRTGSRPRVRKDGTISKPERIHIFWQRRIREGDTETPYWFPSETSGGAVRENRIVLPIPPGTHWSDAKPAVLPGLPANQMLEEGNPHPDSGGPLPEGEGGKKRSRKKKANAAPTLPAQPRGGLWFAPPAPPPPTKEELAAQKKAAAEERKRAAKMKRKNDPKYVAAARELRDRYLEEVNAGQLLPPSAHGKYEVSRQLESAPTKLQTTNLLDAA